MSVKSEIHEMTREMKGGRTGGREVADIARRSQSRNRTVRLTALKSG